MVIRKTRKDLRQQLPPDAPSTLSTSPPSSSHDANATSIQKIMATMVQCMQQMVTEAGVPLVRTRPIIGRLVLGSLVLHIVSQTDQLILVVFGFLLTPMWSAPTYTRRRRLVSRHLVSRHLVIPRPIEGGSRRCRDAPRQRFAAPSRRFVKFRAARVGHFRRPKIQINEHLGNHRAERCATHLHQLIWN